MLDEKICLVTGSAGGIGRAAAIEMARQKSAAVMVSDIDDDAGRETVELVREAGADADYVHCDVEEPEQIRAMVEATVERFGGLDVLHNNAGVQESYFTNDLAVDTLPEEVWEKVYRINLRSVWLATRYAAPHLRRSARGPSIVNAGSTGGLVGYPQCPVYSATKGGVHMLTKSTAVDLAPDVRCNCYCPASVDTQMVQRFRDAAEDVEALERMMVSTHLVPRIGRPEEVAKLVCFLASDDAAWINGVAYTIDGGSLAWRGANA
jgi:NAD(P)-dependent dehydrogenase (short-subunit alcohol dehydrogenase family)